MKSVCSKHEQAYLTECPWCETKAEAKDMIAKGLLYGINPAPAAPPVPTCEWNATKCRAAAVWVWAKPGDGGRFLYCQEHHDTAVRAHGGKASYGWQAERLP